MPLIECETSASIANPKAFIKDLSAFAAATLRKPESYVEVVVRDGLLISHAGDSDKPAFHLRITSLGNINDSANKEYASAFYKFIEDKLQIDASRGYMNFIDPGRPNCALGGKTFG